MSRYPVFAQPAGGYDQSLLQIAPQVTQADRQQGYSVDILEQGGPSNYYGSPNAPRRQQFAGGYEQARSQQRQQPNPSYPYDQSVPPSLEKADYYTPQASLDQDQRDIFTINPYKSPKPWYRTTRGLVIIFIVILLLIGGAVGVVLGVRASTNKVNADRKSAQDGSRTGGVAPTSAERGGEGESTSDPNALPTLPSLSLVRLDTTQAAAATADIVLNLKAPAASAVVQSRPTRATRPTVAGSGPTPAVDPVCARFPSLPACRQL
jgi:hypothetical protein